MRHCMVFLNSVPDFQSLTDKVLHRKNIGFRFSACKRIYKNIDCSSKSSSFEMGVERYVKFSK